LRHKSRACQQLCERLYQEDLFQVVNFMVFLFRQIKNTQSKFVYNHHNCQNFGNIPGFQYLFPGNGVYTLIGQGCTHNCQRSSGFPALIKLAAAMAPALTKGLAERAWSSSMARTELNGKQDCSFRLFN